MFLPIRTDLMAMNYSFEVDIGSQSIEPARINAREMFWQAICF